MPTAPKLVAALWFALMAWFAAEVSKAHFPDGTQFGWYTYMTGAIGFLVGWIFVGKRAGDTMAAAYAYGFTAIIILVFWALFYFSFEEMIHRSLDTRYRGPMDALVGMVDLFKDYAILVLRFDVVVTLLIGGFFGGWLTEQAARRWS
ncbi:TrgA family protein [Celeribacter sp.]|uniref:TrgA family protein n=1 Tax=Celeribacter sp. TaxID=1890673 RepID=UPI003A946B12